MTTAPDHTDIRRRITCQRRLVYKRHLRALFWRRKADEAGREMRVLEGELMKREMLEKST